MSSILDITFYRGGAVVLWGGDFYILRVPLVELRIHSNALSS